MFEIPEEGEELIVKETVSFTMPNKKKQDMYVSYIYFDMPSHKQLLKETGKLEKEENRLRTLAKLKGNEATDEEALLILLEDQFEEDTEDCDFEMLKKSIKDIDGIKDTKGNDIPYTEKLLERILKLKQPRIALIEKFNEIHSDEGRKRAKRKN